MNDQSGHGFFCVLHKCVECNCHAIQNFTCIVKVRFWVQFYFTVYVRSSRHQWQRCGERLMFCRNRVAGAWDAMHCVITNINHLVNASVGIETWYNILTTGKYTDSHELMFEFLVRVPWMEEALDQKCLWQVFGVHWASSPRSLRATWVHLSASALTQVHSSALKCISSAVTWHLNSVQVHSSSLVWFQVCMVA